MGRIQLLDDEVINKIAAGEVVERPASVVKELVENALDAGARHIDISLENGGLKSMAVRDDGLGMDQEDALAALRRHATSKIRAADDLYQISTMGFRGEALASIASVSRMSLATAMDEAEGVRVAFEGTGEPVVWPWSGPRGTTLTVSDLFFNIPVRARFLKSAATEFGYCLELVQAFALCHPHVAFTLRHNGKEQLRVPAVSEALPRYGEAALRARTLAVLGPELASSLVFVEKASRYGQFAGLISPPGVEKGTSRHIYAFVNGRYVKDKVLRYGIMRGYHSHILKGRYPVAVCHLELDPSLVDVNVHPAKTEVRFQYAQEVQGLIALGIRESLRQGAWASPSLLGKDTQPETSSVLGDDLPFGQTQPASEHHAASAAPQESWTPPASGGNQEYARAELPRSPGGFSRSAKGSSFVTRTTRSFDRIEPPATHGITPAESSAPKSTAVWDKAGIEALLREHETETPSESQPIGSSIPWQELSYIGSFANCYLFFEDRDRLLVVDQHAFHERILYERLCSDVKLLQQSQRLLVPEALDLGPAAVASLAESQSDLEARGFGFRIISEAEIEVTAVPTILAGKDLQALFADLTADEHADHAEPSDSNAEMARLTLATIACHAAVRAGESLGEGELRQLLAQARTVDFYHNCPHGRRVFRWWEKEQVGRWFDR